MACGQPAAGSAGGKVPWPGPFTPASSATPPSAPITFPRDEAPHPSLTEWWYYTGHLVADDGAKYGFESVIFQSIRNNIPAYYAAHAAVTDHQRGEFHYDQRTQQRAADQLAGTTDRGFDLKMGDWAWRGLNGTDHVEMTAPGYTLALDLTAMKPPTLHRGGFIDYGPAGSTYYYSRTRMAVTGTIEDHGTRKAVTGEAWFDHQWGNFLTVTTGGWDWFSAELADGSDFTVYLVRGAGQRVLGSLGTFVAADGTVTDIPFDQIDIAVLDRWTSPHTGITYPARWQVKLPGYGLDLTWTPVINDQELDTRQSTGNIYWEGEVTISGMRNGAPIGGEGYVELTGYDQR
jgi:predicted secreted hydrolase